MNPPSFSNYRLQVYLSTKPPRRFILLLMDSHPRVQRYKVLADHGLGPMAFESIPKLVRLSRSGSVISMIPLIN